MENIVFEGKINNGKSILIRYPKTGDEHAVVEYINSISKEQTFIRLQGEELTLEEEKKWLETQIEKIKNRQSIQLFVFSGVKLIGIAGVVMLDKVESHVGSFGISVAKEERGRGIGKLLTELVLKEAEKKLVDLEIIVLGVFEGNDIAHRMYKKFGFAEYGRLPQGIVHRGKHISHIYMYKKIK